MSRVVLLALTACADPPTPAPPVAGEATVVTVVAASCAPAADNALRATCDVELSGPGPATVDLTDGVESVRFTDDAISASHAVTVWGLTADSDWDWTAGDFAGTVRTGQLPDALLVPLTSTAPSGVALPQVLLPSGCGDDTMAVVAGFDGRFRWYHDVSLYADSFVGAVNLGDDDQVLAIVGGHQVVAVDLAGVETLRAVLDDTVHHDVVRKDGSTYVLIARPYVEGDGLTYVEDLVGTLDADGTLVDTWAEHDFFPVAPSLLPGTAFWDDVFPDSHDAWHTNGLFVTDDAHFVLSLKLVNVVLEGSPTGLDWVLAANGESSVFPGDVTLSSEDGDATFADQHHPSLLPDGRLTVFDNSASRGLVLSFDPVAHTAAFESDWPAVGNCPFEGSIYPTEDGGWLVTCGSSHVVRLYAPDGSVVGDLSPACDGQLTIRGAPIDVWSMHAGSVRAERRL